MVLEGLVILSLSLSLSVCVCVCVCVCVWVRVRACVCVCVPIKYLFEQARICINLKFIVDFLKINSTIIGSNHGDSVQPVMPS